MGAPFLETMSSKSLPRHRPSPPTLFPFSQPTSFSFFLKMRMSHGPFFFWPPHIFLAFNPNCRHPPFSCFSCSPASVLLGRHEGPNLAPQNPRAKPAGRFTKKKKQKRGVFTPRRFHSHIFQQFGLTNRAPNEAFHSRRRPPSTKRPKRRVWEKGKQPQPAP